jgi:hypothetical protein
MGSGGGVPNHATYVTQKIGSGWYFQYSRRGLEVKGCLREAGLANIGQFGRLSRDLRLTLLQPLC